MVSAKNSSAGLGAQVACLGAVVLLLLTRVECRITETVFRPVGTAGKMEITIFSFPKSSYLVELSTQAIGPAVDPPPQNPHVLGQNLNRSR